jgi:cytochrome P450
MTPTAQLSLDKIDFSDLDLFDEGPPHDLFARVRAEGGMHWTEGGPNGDGFWSVMSYNELVKATKDWQTFSSARRSFTIADGMTMPREFERAMFLSMDPPEHNKHRDIVKKVFTPQMVARQADEIRRLVVDAIGGVVERGECDLVELVMDLPLSVMADMLGVPRADRERLLHWTAQFAEYDEATVRDDPEGPLKAIAEMGTYLFELVTDRRANPRDDLLSRLIAADADGQTLNDAEVIADFILLMGGGVETTRNAAVGGLLLLHEHPDERRKLLDDPALIPNAVEEILRYHSPFTTMSRTATTDTELAGAQIGEGQKVVLWYASANRDATANPDPDRFDVSRSEIKHVAFGGGGRHHCIGLQLARLELKIFFAEALRRLPQIAPAAPPKRLRSNFIHGFISAPVCFTPGAPAA